MRTLLSIFGFLFTLSVTSARAEEVSRTIDVSAQSVVEVTPDEAVISFSIRTEDPSLLNATTQNAEIAATVINSLHQLKIPGESLKVTDFDLGRRRDRNGDPLTNYYVQRYSVLRVDDFNVVDKVVSELIASGVSEVSELKFQLKNQRESQVEARRLAFEYVKEKATHWAELSGMKLGDVIKVTENVQYNSHAGGFGGMGGGMGSVLLEPSPRIPSLRVDNQPGPLDNFYLVAFQEREKSPAADVAPFKGTLVVPGQIRLNCTVNVIFELKSAHASDRRMLPGSLPPN